MPKKNWHEVTEQELTEGQEINIEFPGKCSEI